MGEDTGKAVSIGPGTQVGALLILCPEDARLSFLVSEVPCLGSDHPVYDLEAERTSTVSVNIY